MEEDDFSNIRRSILLNDVKSDLSAMRDFILRNRSSNTLALNIKDYNFLNSLAESFGGETESYDGFVYDPKRHMDRIDRKNEEIRLNFFNNILRDHPLIHTSCENVSSFLEDINFIPIEFINNQRKFSISECSSIILDFFSLFGEDTYRIIEDAFRNGNILFNVDLSEDEDDDPELVDKSSNKKTDTAGFCQYIHLLNKPYILLMTDSTTIGMKYLVHELGHVIEKRKYETNQSRNVCYDEAILSEMPALFYEYLFTDYLIKNHIAYDNSIINANRDLMLIKSYAESYLKVTDSDDVTLSKVTGHFIIPEDGKYLRYDLGRAVFYGFGGILAKYLCELYYQDPIVCSKVFNDLMCSEKSMSTIQKLESVGVDPYEVAYPDAIKPRMLEISSKAKKRYNINV